MLLYFRTRACKFSPAKDRVTFFFFDYYCEFFAFEGVNLRNNHQSYFKMRLCGVRLLFYIISLRYLKFFFFSMKNINASVTVKLHISYWSFKGLKHIFCLDMSFLKCKIKRKECIQIYQDIFHIIWINIFVEHKI